MNQPTDVLGRATSMSGRDRQIAEQRLRLRLLYSLGDFQLALSAAAFLDKCDPKGKYSTVELRRFRCYETTAIMAYTRPFSESKGSIPKLNLKIIDAPLSGQQKELHQTLMTLRNKVVAHSDADMMRLVSKTEHIMFGNGFEFQLLQTVFDEGLTFIGDKLHFFKGLLHVLLGTLTRKMIEEAQKEPEGFNFRKDYLNS